MIILILKSLIKYPSDKTISGVIERLLQALLNTSLLHQPMPFSSISLLSMIEIL